MRRVIFLNRYFSPDHSATSQILGDLASYLADQGREVHVIASRQLYDDPNADLESEDKIKGVFVHRIPSSRFGRSTHLGRVVDYISFYYRLRRYLRRFVRRGDIVIAKTDPPLLSVVATRVVHRRNADIINWLQDIYPEIATSLNVPFTGVFAGLLRRLRNNSLRSAKLNIVVGQLMRDTIEACAVPSSHIRVIPNWADDEDIVPIDNANNPLRSRWNLRDKFVVGYSGNLGLAHDFETILAAALQLRNCRNIIFLFIGGGRLLKSLVPRIKELGLEQTFRIMGYQHRDLLKYSLSVADVHLISLRPNLEGLIVPSKFYGVAAAGRPIIAIAAKHGEIGQLVLGNDCGSVIDLGDSAGLAATLLALSHDSRAVLAMGQNARKLLDNLFTRRHSLQLWSEVLEVLDSDPAKPGIKH